MSGMTFIGAGERAKEARAALNRLRWEVDHAISQGRAEDAASADLAEAVGIFTNILTTLDAALPDRPANELEALLLGPPRQRFMRHMEWYTMYHQTPR